MLTLINDPNEMRVPIKAGSRRKQGIGTNSSEMSPTKKVSPKQLLSLIYETPVGNSNDIYSNIKL